MKKAITEKPSRCDWKEKMSHPPCDTIYGLGFIGAAIYNISVATGFWSGVWGVIKAIFWPAFLVYKLMKSLGM